MTSPPTRIFGRCSFDHFVERGEVQHRLLDLGRQAGTGSSLALLAEPGAGSSELLRQTYDYLFYENRGIAPVYFDVRSADLTAEATARRFLRAFLLQMTAFRRRERGLLAVSATTAELQAKALASDREWTAEASRIAEVDDPAVIIDLCLSAPARAAAGGAYCVIFIDALFGTSLLKDGEELLRSFFRAAAASPVPFVLTGPRRQLFGKSELSSLKLERLRGEAASGLIEQAAGERGVGLNDVTRDLIALQLDGDTRHIANVFTSAAETGQTFDSFAAFERVYTDEIFGGRIGRYYDAVIDTLLPGSAGRRLLSKIKHTSEAYGTEPGHCSRESLGLSHQRHDAAIAALHQLEIINAGPVEITSSDRAFLDYARARASLSAATRPRASVVGSVMVANIKRAPELMASMYRTRSAVNPRELFAEFQGQSVSAANLDYPRFKTDLKGMNDDQILAELNRSSARVDLPRILFTVHTADLYPQFTALCERELSAVGIAADEVWLAVEIESKLEATRELTEFWCDRLEMAAAANDFENFRLWLIAPEGFDDEAARVLADRRAIGSSRKQVELLRKVLGEKSAGETPGVIEEFERVVPMGEESEVLSARTVEELGRRYDIPQRTLNQIKTALVEACINAAEHSLSPDRKLYQRFVLTQSQLTITVSNRGIRLADRKLRLVSPSEGRRGWGLKLMRGLMDDVKIEETDDGSRITMVKLLSLDHPAQTAAS